MGCKDPVTKELNKRGYNLVRLPRTGIEPLDILGRAGDSMERLGSIDEVWTSAVPKPVPGAPASVVGIEGEHSNDLDLGIGLKLLSNALAGLGSSIGLPSLNLGFKKAKKMQFKFVNVESVSVSPLALGKFLAHGTLDMSNPFAAHYFGNDDTQEYIIFDILRSDSISVTAKSESGATVDADVSALSGALSANVKLKVGSAGSTEITFQGTAKATFAFKLFEVFFENGAWIPRGVGADDDLSFAVSDPESKYGASVVLNPERSVRVR